MKKHAAKDKKKKNLKTSLGLFTEIIMSIQFKWKKSRYKVVYMECCFFSLEPCLQPYGMFPFSKKGRRPFYGVIA
jgi:hypothetical protein